MSDIHKVLCFFEGLSSRDPALAMRYVDAGTYVDRSPDAEEGIAGREYIAAIAADGPDLKVIRAFQDGAFVVTQSDGQFRGSGVFFDVFRFANGLIVEHWGFSAETGPPNKGGHTQIDGPTQPKPGEDTEANKALVRLYYETVHIAGRHDAIPQFFSGDHCVRHEPGVADGVEEFQRDLETLTRDRTIDAIALLLGQGDFVFIVADGTHQNAPCHYVDLYRVEKGKLAEHWGFAQ